MTERPLERFRPLQCDPWGWSDAAGWNSGEADGALGRVGAREGVHAHPQPVVLGVGAERQPAAVHSDARRRRPGPRGTRES
jgi:hypothetical protein